MRGLKGGPFLNRGPGRLNDQGPEHTQQEDGKDNDDNDTGCGVFQVCPSHRPILSIQKRKDLPPLPRPSFVWVAQRVYELQHGVPAVLYLFELPAKDNPVLGRVGIEKQNRAIVPGIPHMAQHADQGSYSDSACDEYQVPLFRMKGVGKTSEGSVDGGPVSRPGLFYGGSKIPHLWR